MQARSIDISGTMKIHKEYLTFGRSCLRSADSKTSLGLLSLKRSIEQVFVQKGSAAELPYEEGTFDLVTAIETVYFWPNLPGCVKGIHRVLKTGGRFAIMVEVVDADSKWTNFVEGMTAYTPEQLKSILDDAGFTQTEIHCKKPMYATILGVKP